MSTNYQFDDSRDGVKMEIVWNALFPVQRCALGQAKTPSARQGWKACASSPTWHNGTWPLSTIVKPIFSQNDPAEGNRYAP